MESEWVQEVMEMESRPVCRAGPLDTLILSNFSSRIQYLVKENRLHTHAKRKKGSLLPNHMSDAGIDFAGV